MQIIKDALDAIEGDERFIMTLGAGVVNTALLLAGYIDPITYRDLTVATVAVFIGGSSYTSAVAYRENARVNISRESPWEGEGV